MPKNDLTPYATEGFNALPEAICPHYLTSPVGMAWSVGAWLKSTGRSAPNKVFMSRGYTIRANDMLLDASKAPTICRIN